MLFWPGQVIFFALCMLVLPGVGNAADLKAVAAAPPPHATDKRLQALLDTHKGHPVIINFWATWCEPCREEMPSLQRQADRLRGQGLVVITVAVADNPSHVEDFFRDHVIQLPTIDDREKIISRAWGIHALPATVVLDRHHRMRLRGLGAINWDTPAIDKSLQVLLH